MKCAVESIESCWDDLVDMTRRHFETHGQRYNPEKDRYKAMEQAGAVFVVAIRDGADLVGYAIMYVFRSMHDQALQAQEDFFYIEPTYRLGWLATALLHAVEDECRNRGCEEIKMTVDIGLGAGTILCARGYEIVSRNYRKSLVRADSPSKKEAAS